MSNIDTQEEIVPYHHDKSAVQDKLVSKLAACFNVQRALLQQLAELPGAVTITDDGRDLTRLLDEEVMRGRSLSQMIELNTVL